MDEPESDAVVALTCQVNDLLVQLVAVQRLLEWQAREAQTSRDAQSLTDGVSAS